MENPAYPLVRLAAALGAANTGGELSSAERRILEASHELPKPPPTALRAAKAAIKCGEDPLGETFYSIRDAVKRRADGAVYTPVDLVTPMIDWALDQRPERIVDAGSGSGRFLAEILRRKRRVAAVAIDTDPVATMMTRAVASVLGATNVHVIQGDYLKLKLPTAEGRTAFIGNPPYVRHHQLGIETKKWAQTTAKTFGLRVSGLAGLHAHFFLATAVHSQPEDVGCFVTSAEWLDVNYGGIVRKLLLDRLGGESMHIVEPTALPFVGTQTTAVITTFNVGRRPESMRIQDVESLDQLKDLSAAGAPINRARLTETPRWSGLLRAPAKPPRGFIELGELCRVHRGAVTGANSVWIINGATDLPKSVLYPSITKARELFSAGAVLAHDRNLKRVIDLPRDLDVLDASERGSVMRFIDAAKKDGVHQGYIAAHRRPWWSIGLKAPAPILATYMARRSPAFVLNAAEARHINIAHGIYPRQALNHHALTRLAEALRSGALLSQGRVYAGGLTKFEPREMERLWVPDLATLLSHEPLAASLDV